MSLRIDWRSGSPPNDYQDVDVQDVASSWSPKSAIFKAGRDISAWMFGLSLSSPLSPTFCGKAPFFADSDMADLFIEGTPHHHIRNNSQPSIPLKPPTSIHSLPRELLEEIFLHYVHGPDDTPTLDLTGSYRRIATRNTATTTPMVLAHVCSSWRVITFSYALLWSVLYVFRPREYDLPLFEFWLDRSGNYPLDLTVIQGYLTEDPSLICPTRRALMSALHSSWRWRKVSVQVYQDMEPLLATLPYTSLQGLQEFEGNLFEWSFEGSQALSRLLSQCQSLRGVSWGGACLGPAVYFETQWSQLSQANIDCVHLYDLYPLLHHMQSLQSLCLGNLTGCVEQIGPLPIETPMVQLPRLTSLSLGRYEDVAPLFNRITLPSLATLSLSAGVGLRTEPRDAWLSLYHLVRRSRCRIRSLVWSHFGLSEEALIESFTKASTTSLPFLDHLVIKSQVGVDAVRALMSLEGRTPLFPVLRYLELSDFRADIEEAYTLGASRSELMSFVAAKHGRRYFICRS